VQPGRGIDLAVKWVVLSVVVAVRGVAFCLWVYHPGFAVTVARPSPPIFRVDAGAAAASCSAALAPPAHPCCQGQEAAPWRVSRR